MPAAPMLLIALTGLLLGLGAWGFLRARRQEADAALAESHNDLLLLGLLVLAAFTLGVFLTYLLLGLHW